MRNLTAQPETDLTMSDLLTMARNILAASENQEWQQLGRLVANWRGELNRFFDNAGDAADGALSLDDVLALNEINHRVIVLVEEYRDLLSVQLKALRQGHKAVSAYRDSGMR